MERAIKSLKMFKHLCDAKEAKDLIVVATKAVRKATNQDEFLHKVKNEVNIDITVLSGEEEAYYAYFGVINSMDISDGLVMDIGGSSTELIWIKNKKRLKV